LGVLTLELHAVDSSSASCMYHRLPVHLVDIQLESQKSKRNAKNTEANRVWQKYVIVNMVGRGISQNPLSCAAGSLDPASTFLPPVHKQLVRDHGRRAEPGGVWQAQTNPTMNVNSLQGWHENNRWQSNLNWQSDLNIQKLHVV
jgi:hypothetical protein